MEPSTPNTYHNTNAVATAATYLPPNVPSPSISIEDQGKNTEAQTIQQLRNTIQTLQTTIEQMTNLIAELTPLRKTIAKLETRVNQLEGMKLAQNITPAMTITSNSPPKTTTMLKDKPQL
ncbi:hypothetical protein BC941DRAFT_475971 [Chlamydoabsidia padenii]|nr:hypothetical protein BC941DRAFT_475971 [Chlamydoabsidia padenii]